MSIPPTWGDLGDKRDFSRNGIQAITFRSEISRVSLGNRGGGDEGAGTKQNFSVQCTEVAPDLDTPGRKRRGRLKKLILKGAQSWRFCCYNWRSLYSYLSPPIPSLSLAPPPQGSGLGPGELCSLLQEALERGAQDVESGPGWRGPLARPGLWKVALE